MSNENENQETAVAMTEQEGQGLAEFFASDFDKELKDAKPVLALSKNYLEFKKKGDSMRVVFLGMGEYKEIKDGKTLVHLIANFADGERKCYYTRSVKIIQDVQGIARFSNLEITFDGSEDIGNNRTLKHFTVMLLK